MMNRGYDIETQEAREKEESKENTDFNSCYTRCFKQM